MSAPADTGKAEPAPTMKVKATKVIWLSGGPPAANSLSRDRKSVAIGQVVVLPKAEAERLIAIKHAVAAE